MRLTCPRCGLQTEPSGMGGHIRKCPVTPEELFWAKVDKSGGPKACWRWTGATRAHGYGAAQIIDNGKRRIIGAHRVAWMYAHGQVPKGMHVLHVCDNTGCVNPAHLWLGTHQDNMDDRSRKNRVSRTGNKPRRQEVANAL